MEIIFIITIPVIVYLLSWLARRNPDKRWVRVLFSNIRGMRSDVKHMTRRDIFRSALNFFLFAIGLIVIYSLIGYLAVSLFEDVKLPTFVSNFSLAISFVVTVLFVILIIKSLYLFFRGLFRRKDFVPPIIYGSLNSYTHWEIRNTSGIWELKIYKTGLLGNKLIHSVEAKTQEEIIQLTDKLLEQEGN